MAALDDEPVVDPFGGVALLVRPPPGSTRVRARPTPRARRGRASTSVRGSARRATCPPCRRTSPQCCSSRRASSRSLPAARLRRPSTVYHSSCLGARSSPPPFPGGLGKVSAREYNTARAAPPGTRGRGPRALSAQFLMTTVLKSGDHSDRFYGICCQANALRSIALDRRAFALPGQFKYRRTMSLPNSVIW